ncbi:DUF4432 family protein [Kaistia algarum]|nr:DUF4432 family protein [Kaistia algarum]
MSQLGGVRLITSDNGPSRGVRLVEFRTGTGFTFEIGVDRGFDVGRCDYRGASLAWMPPTMLPGPWYFEDQANFGWLRAGLGGFNNTCGLLHIGNPEDADVSHYNFPARPTDHYGVHDRAALIPAELVSLGERWIDGSYVMEAIGRVTQAQAYGENLVLTRTYRAVLGQSAFTMEDVVENRGYTPTSHMLLYHINIGYPFVDYGAEFIAPSIGTPKLLFGTADLEDRTSWSRFVAPQRNWIQQTFEHRMRANESGEVEVAIFNPRLMGGIGLSVAYDQKTLPNYIEWRMMGEGQYAVGIEPCSNGFGRREIEDRGELIVLQPGESRRYTLRVAIIDADRADEMRMLESATR